MCDVLHYLDKHFSNNVRASDKQYITVKVGVFDTISNPQEDYCLNFSKHYWDTVQFFDSIYWEFDKDFFNQVSYVESLLFDFTNDSTIENGLTWDTGFWDKNNFFWNSIDFKDVVQIYLNTL